MKRNRKAYPAPDQTVDLVPSFKILVTCRSERDLVQLLDRLTKEGYPCRVLQS